MESVASSGTGDHRGADTQHATPHFLGNAGWPKEEFDSLFTREVLDKEDLVLPVWAGVSVRDVYAYSPGLANRLGIEWALGVEEVTRRLLKVIL